MDRQYYASHALTPESADVWWEGFGGSARSKNFTAIETPADAAQAPGELADRNMELRCLIQDGQTQVMRTKNTITVEPKRRRCIDCAQAC